MIEFYIQNFKYYYGKKFGLIFEEKNILNRITTLCKENNIELIDLTSYISDNYNTLAQEYPEAYFINLTDISNLQPNNYKNLFHIIFNLHYKNALYFIQINDIEQLNKLTKISNLSISHDLNEIIYRLYLNYALQLIINDNIIVNSKSFHLYPLPILNFTTFLDVNSINHSINITREYILEITFNNKTYSINYVRYKQSSNTNPKFIELTANNLKAIISSTLSLDTFLSNIHQIQYDNQLDEYQQQAVNAINGPIRVLAPAGAGKTKTLITRIVNLLNNGIHPSEILVLAFNKKAANEIRERLSLFNIESKNNLWTDNICVKTFHALGYEIIRDTLNWPLDLDNSHYNHRNIIKNTLKEISDIPANRIENFVENFIYEVNNIKSGLKQLKPNDIVKINGHYFNIYNFFNKYQELVEKHQFYNFDDMIYLALKILITYKDYLEKINNKYNYILVDEFQDLNDSQFNLLNILAKPNENIFVVGDDDQMIYSWRGAKLEYILNFENYYPTSNTIILQYNYRCGKEIVNHANRLIKYNKNRIDKDIKPFAKSKDGKINVKFSNSIWQQAIDLTNEIIKLKNEHNYKWSDFAILYRFHAYAFPIAIYMDKQNIPHSPVNYKTLLKSGPVTDILSYMTVLLHPNFASASDFERILFRPLKYLKHSTIFAIKDINAFNNYYSDDSKDNQRLDNFREKINSLQKYLKDLTSYELLKLLDETFKLKKFYEEQFKILDVDEAPEAIIFDVVLDLSREFPDIYNFFEFLNNSEINNSNKNSNNDEITFTTIHSTKGNEFLNTVIFNLVKDKPDDHKELEEERRLAYVAVTRGKERTLISTNKNNYSIFIAELLQNPIYKGLTLTQLETNLLKLKLNSFISNNDEIFKQISSLENEIEIRKLLR
ncbi:MAG TPA: ATP-dependent helicase [Ignavibacteriales bacterium]|nr:ATP-dependent helicase [Ignavibacteriales bacterium]HOL81000.1 ATP-dependent helicase [Ignavibacteriales bacterium]HOM64736.1 ATP-dependent helicase [Ignavibacteriales bacterium]HPD66732.1 ATP-dependent helicase [Ignavibacteriales bacterium]HPP32780.1 ATP-dependent helicase [Ignavibacteriales bacterium]